MAAVTIHLQQKSRQRSADATFDVFGTCIDFRGSIIKDCRAQGNARGLITDQKFEGDNITPALKSAGAGSGAPIQNIKDYGFDIGGPIMKSKLWYWGSYGAQDIKVGVVGFYKKTA